VGPGRAKKRTSSWIGGEGVRGERGGEMVMKRENRKATTVFWRRGCDQLENVEAVVGGFCYLLLFGCDKGLCIFLLKVP